MLKNSKQNENKKLSVFDHVKHIRQIQDPNYYLNLSDENKKSFNHFMILRALSMDSRLVETMAMLYQYLDKIPSSQFYTLLIKLVPKDNGFYPWIKSKIFRNNKELLNLVSKRFDIPTYQANVYVNLLLKSENGKCELINLCKSFGLEEDEIEKLFEIDK